MLILCALWNMILKSIKSIPNIPFDFLKEFGMAILVIFGVMIAFNLPYAIPIVMLVFYKSMMKEMGKVNYSLLLISNIILFTILVILGIFTGTPIIFLDYLFIIATSNAISVFFSIACVSLYDPLNKFCQYTKKTFKECLEECKNKN